MKTPRDDDHDDGPNTRESAGFDDWFGDDDSENSLDFDERDLLNDELDAAGWRSAAGGDGGPEDDYEVVALSDRSEREPESYTLVPRDVDEVQLTTWWITADSGSTVALDEIR